MLSEALIVFIVIVLWFYDEVIVFIVFLMMTLHDSLVAFQSWTDKYSFCR